MSSLLCGTLYISCYLHIFAQVFVYQDRITLRVFGSGGLAVGSHPIPFRTRKLSPLAAMVLAFTGWESS